MNRTPRTKAGLLLFSIGFASLFTSVLYADEYFNKREKHQYFKWVDSKGHVHYSQTAPKKGDAVQIQRIKASDNPPANQDSANKAKEFEAERAKLINDTGAQKQAGTPEKIAVEARKKNCETAKANLSRLKGEGRIRIKNSDGEYEYLNEDTRQTHMTENSQYLQENCP